MLALTFNTITQEITAKFQVTVEVWDITEVTDLVP